MPDQVSAASSPQWSWDQSLYAGSARHYAVGRVAYPAELADVLAEALQLDGTGTLVDVGCGPGSLTLLLAARFGRAIGVDADPDMLTEASRLAAAAGIRNADWRNLRAEQLPADLPPARAVSFAQSFHWLDRPRVAAAARAMLAPGGAVVHVHATTHQGVAGAAALPHPRPPREEITALVRRHLGPQPRAGQGVLTAGPADSEDVVYRGAGLRGPQRFELPGRVVVRTADEVVASVYSLSSAAPHLFGDRLPVFDAELRALVGAGPFAEQMRSIAVDVWRPSGS